MATARKRKDTRFDKVSEEQLRRAQQQLDELCKKHHLRTWKLQSGKANWRELCLRLFGLPAVNAEPMVTHRGRRRRSDEKIWEIGRFIDSQLQFDDLSNRSSIKLKLRKIYIDVEKRFALLNAKVPGDKARGIYNQYLRAERDARGKKN